ncbi:prepilin peptidase [Fructobacillus pseudoficulneus]|uniref:prepilin peptidase n=1 Tax=Fructobacillus pseudoficulneus TaxID=220714 RepID=UPI0008A7ACF9|nr:type 4 prepilin peptidase 1 Aspartic peptidase. MEROPS family A24A [Fructobacillus pseudoficulneus]
MNTILLYFINLILTSLLICLADRSALNRPLWTSRSYCFHCQQQLRWFELIPIFSVLFLHGRCRSCQTSYANPFRLAFFEAAVPAFATYLTTIGLWGATITFYLLFFLASEDVLTQTCSSWLAWVFLTGIFYGHGLHNRWWLSLALLVLCFCLIALKLLGSGDVPVLLLLLNTLSPGQFATSLLLASLAALIWLLLSHQRKLPFIPFLWFSWTCVQFWP